MSSESTKSEEPVLTPELAYLKMISASAFHVATQLKINGVKPDTRLVISNGELLIPGTHIYTYSNSIKEVWKVSESIHKNPTSETAVKYGFALTAIGQLLDYVDYGKGPMHELECKLLPFMRDDELEKGNIMKNDIVVGLGALCMRYGIDKNILNVQ